MTDKKWFLVPIHSDPSLGSRLTNAGFALVDGDYQDAQGRVVHVSMSEVRIGIPTADLVSEQEQLEFLVGFLGLDEERITRV